MSRVIRIGTRDSELALWQAKTIQEILEELGHKTTLVPVKSTGDLNLNKPIYELGITGVFTRTLDIAMLNNDIDIAVHSLKDVPTTLPQGIVQAAVIKRGNVRDTLVFKKNEEFLAQREAIIATGSLRRRAQWLHRYPTHTIVGLRGNVNTRLQKLEDHDDWNGAIFAAAGIGRLDIRPEDAVNLDWMIPAPAQGTIMITALEEDEEIRTICAEINHVETEICTNIEREFLRLLEGGCTAPIGALAYIKDEKVFFEGALLSTDGSKKIEVTREVNLEDKDEVAQWCADYIVERGGKRMMDDIKRLKKQTNIYSTKALTEGQLQLMNTDIITESADFIQIKFNRMAPHLLKSEIRNVIITSKNSVESLTTSFSADQLKFKNIYCVGRRTKKMIESRIGKVTHSERNAKRLADYLVDHLEGTEVTYFCSDLRLDDLPTILKKNHIMVNEIEAYQTAYASKKIDDNIEGVMFYSPSTVQSFILKNTADKIAFCIGESTAKEAKKHFKDVRVAKVPTVESVIELVNEHYL
jgi:hydroxymethylbilane synthase